MVFVVGAADAQSLSNQPVEWSMSAQKWALVSLAKKLTEPYQTDREKVRSIFLWITDNISYRTAFKNLRNSNKKKVLVEEYGIDSLTLNERIAYNVVQQGAAVCDGYARLFKTLCDYAGIRSQIITGFARNDAGHVSTSFHSNHSWNAVFVDSAWQLLDATWASGYFLYHSNEFVKHYDAFYFLTPPRQFNEDHFPEDLFWTLEEKPTVLPELSFSPFKFSSFLKYKFQSYAPQRGTMSTAIGDTLHFELSLKTDENRGILAPDGLYDSSVVLPPTIADIKPDVVSSDGKIIYHYVVPSADVDWVQIIYNNDYILRYKLSIKK